MKYIEHPLVVTYEDLEKVTTLDPNQRMRDELLLNSAHRAVEKYIGNVLTRRIVTQRTEADRGVITLYYYPVVSVTSVTDAGTNEAVGNTTLSKVPDTEEYCVKLDSMKTGFVDVTYVAGYAPEDLPGVFAEAVIKTFLYKRNTFRQLEAGEEAADPEDVISDEVKSMLDPYRRKTW